jgi:hypothetical protein
VPPPSRGSRNAGAFAPSASAVLPTTVGSTVSTDGLFAGGIGTPGLSAIAFDAAVRAADSAVPDDLNFFDGAVCDAAEAALPGFPFRAFLPALLAPARGAFAAGFFADFAGWARTAFRTGVLGDFLRVFLDIRLPFVAFAGSTIRVIARASWNRADCWANLMASEYAYREFDAPPIRSLNVLLGPDDEQGY